jgi:hypothetical protein
VLELFVSSVSIEDKSRVSGNKRVDTSLKVFDMFDAWVEVLESTTELCIVDDVSEVMYEKG